ncbi:YgzB family protein, partial [Bacillus pumilus]
MNKMRRFGVSLVFVGFVMMYMGVLFKEWIWLWTFFMVVGVLWIG